MLCMAGRGAGQPRYPQGYRGKSGLHETRVAGNARRASGFGPPFRESATESRPPTASWRGKGERVRQERTGRLATEAAWQTPPGARPNRGGASRSNPRQGCFAPTARVGCLSLAATQGLEEWLPVRRGSSDTTRITEPGLQAPRQTWLKAAIDSIADIHPSRRSMLGMTSACQGCHARSHGRISIFQPRSRGASKL